MTGNIRNFRPDHQTSLIAQIVKILIVLIVRQTNSRRAHFANQIHILVVVFREERVADPQSVLVTGYAAQGIFFAVQNKSAFGIYFKTTATETGTNRVYRFATANNLHFATIQIRIFATIPKVCVFNRKARL